MCRDKAGRAELLIQQGEAGRWRWMERRVRRKDGRAASSLRHAAVSVGPLLAASVWLTVAWLVHARIPGDRHRLTVIRPLHLGSTLNQTSFRNVMSAIEYYSPNIKQQPSS